MSKKISQLMLTALGLFFLLLDQWLKYQALHAWNYPRLINKFLGWEPFLNPGVAFGIPLPNFITIVFSIAIIILLVFLLAKSSVIIHQSLFILIIAGALSNFIDRLLYAHTIDYLLILTGYVNLADLLILAGLIIYLLRQSAIKRHSNKNW